MLFRDDLVDASRVLNLAVENFLNLSDRPACGGYFSAARTFRVAVRTIPAADVWRALHFVDNFLGCTSIVSTPRASARLRAALVWLRFLVINHANLSSQPSPHPMRLTSSRVCQQCCSHPV